MLDIFWPVKISIKFMKGERRETGVARFHATPVVSKKLRISGLVQICGSLKLSMEIKSH